MNPFNTAARLFKAADLDELSRQAAGALTTAAKSKNGTFSVALSGGSTPKHLYSLLANPPYKALFPWDKVHFFFGDERCVPPDHPDSNFKMANEAMFLPAGVPAERIHRMKAELPPDDAAKAYADELKRFFGGKPVVFDWLFLGVGDDGHTASLFPDTAALKETKRTVVANRVEKLNTFRITLTYPVLNAAKTVAFLMSGPAKAPVLAKLMDGTADFPSAGIKPTSGDLRYYVDNEAASLLTPMT